MFIGKKYCNKNYTHQKIKIVYVYLLIKEKLLNEQDISYWAENRSTDEDEGDLKNLLRQRGQLQDQLLLIRSNLYKLDIHLKVRNYVPNRCP